MKAARALTLIVALVLPALPAMAWQAPRPVAPQSHHQPGHKPGPQMQPFAPHHAARPQPGRPVAKAPRVGERVRGALPFRQAAGSRFRSPPRGQEYRVANDHLVLVNSRTLQVVAVVGLLSALVR